MRLSYNVAGAERKSLVAAISQELNAPTKYLGMPTAAYEVGDYHIDKTGTVTGPDNLDLEDSLHQLGFDADGETRQYDEPDTYESGLGILGAVDDVPDFVEPRMTEGEELGLGREQRDHSGEDGIQASDVPESYTYQAELSDPECPDRMEVFGAEDDEDALRQAYEYCEGEVTLLELFQLDDDYNTVRSVEIPSRGYYMGLAIEMPLDGFTPEKLDNLTKMVEAKALLLKAALDTDDLPIKRTSDTLQFPWFHGFTAAEHADAYTTLISLLCKAAKEKKRVTAKEKVTENPKYAMRCFLLSLGMIGPEYKNARKILLSKLEGNSSWKNGKKAEVAVNE